jgi:hypothetical protein
MRKIITAVLLFAATAALAADAPKPYHLILEANPAAAFPYLSKFGKFDLHIYRGGVRADTVWLDGFSRVGDANVTVLNPLGRLYVEVPVTDISKTVANMVPAKAVERMATATMGPVTTGKVVGIAATRYRLVYGPAAWIDYWTTDAIAENPQVRAIVQQLVEGISPGTGEIVKSIHGTPLFVELNFSHYKKVPILYVKKFAWQADDEEDALTRGPIYIHASVLESIWK